MQGAASRRFAFESISVTGNFQSAGLGAGLVTLLPDGSSNFFLNVQRSPDEFGEFVDVDQFVRIIQFGDFDEDGEVDGADLARAAANFGILTGATHTQGDADRDGDVDGDDILVVQRQLHVAGGGFAIPEPASFAMAALGALACPSVHPRWRQQKMAAAARRRQRDLLRRGRIPDAGAHCSE